MRGWTVRSPLLHGTKGTSANPANPTQVRKALAVLSLVLPLLAGGLPRADAQLPLLEPVDYVDPMIGTLGPGFVFPGPAAPFGMVQLSPDTDGYLAYTGYMYSDAAIRGFSHHHIESMGVKSNGNLPFMPTVGPVQTDPRLYSSRFEHATEEASPGYYSVLLADHGVTAELTAGTRVGMHRYTFPPSPQSNVILDVGRSNRDWQPWNPDASLHESSLDIVDDDLILGSAESDQGYTIHFAARFDRAFERFGTWTEAGAEPVEGATSAQGRGAGGYVGWDTTIDRDVVIKVGISFVSRQNALLNLNAEQGGFDDLMRGTREAWNEALSTIRVTGGTDADRTSFYTALYHAQHHPNVYSDANGEYMGYDGVVHETEGHEQYVNFSLWDTYRGENQLLATIQPQRYRDMVLSLMDVYEQAGRFPQWAMNNALPDFMVGDPVQMTIVDGYCRGLVAPQDAQAVYDALWDQANRVRRGWNADYLDKGWVANGPSETLEYALADFSLALMAHELGQDADRGELLRRADNWRHVIDPAIGFARPKDAAGNWQDPYSPEAPSQAVPGVTAENHFVEGTGWQYTWLVPHDLRALFQVLDADGDDSEVREKLDTFFSTALTENVPLATPEFQKLITAFGILYAGNQYAPSNEHDLHAPYLYNYAGQPWKTQGIVRNYMSLFRAAPDGLPGNDDLGSMSAWYVWSALGMYPVTGGAPVYALGSPVFETAAVHPAGGGPGFRVTADGASPMSRYVRSATLGGAALDRSWVTHEELFEAGNLAFEMGPVANTSWAATPDSAPPSVTSDGLDAFGCQPAGDDMLPVPTTLTYTGDTHARGERVTLAARLASPDGPVPGAEIVFEIGGQVLTAVTDEEGAATSVVTIPDHGRSQVVAVRFGGTERLEPSETAATITWGRPG